MTLELSEDERDTLKQLLDNELRELNPEIRHSRTPSFRDNLKSYQQVLQKLRSRLEA